MNRCSVDSQMLHTDEFGVIRLYTDRLLLKTGNGAYSDVQCFVNPYRTNVENRVSS